MAHTKMSSKKLRAMCDDIKILKDDYIKSVKDRKIKQAMKDSNCGFFGWLRRFLGIRWTYEQAKNYLLQSYPSYADQSKFACYCRGFYNPLGYMNSDMLRIHQLTDLTETNEEVYVSANDLAEMRKLEQMLTILTKANREEK